MIAVTVNIVVVATLIVFATITAFGSGVKAGDDHVESLSDYKVIGTFGSKDIQMSRVFKLARTPDGSLVSVVDLEDGGVILTRERSLDDFEPLTQ